MNWLGDKIQKIVEINDTVLDLGCGIMQAISGLRCKYILACDIWKPYLETLKKDHPTICIRMNELDKFLDSSYDIVLCLDVLEHLEFNEALNAIYEMKRICRKKLIIYTPDEFKTNHEAVKDVWGLGYNQYQEHRCLLKSETLANLGFKVKRDNEDGGNFVVWSKNGNIS